MKSTGIIRRVDKLGRIVIPKEIRRNLKIREEDNLEIFIDSENIILKKYSRFSNLFKEIENIAISFNSLTNKNIIITDMEKVLSSNISNIENEYLTDNYVNLIEKRDNYISNNKVILDVINKKDKDKYYLLSPIIINGEVIGSIFIYSYNDIINDNDKMIVKFILKYLEKNIED